jgi:hypothetical protein
MVKAEPAKTFQDLIVWQKALLTSDYSFQYLITILLCD